MMLGSSKDLIAMHDGTVLVTHGPDICDGQPCCIHNPSQHRMAAWPQFWHNGWKVMFRRCPHEGLFIDPDELKLKLFPWQMAALGHTYSCDLCEGGTVSYEQG